MTADERARRLARELLAAACADDRPGVPLAARLEDAAAAVLGPELAADRTPPPAFVRGPGDEECVDFEVGPPLPVARCETDGHYLCAACVWNARRERAGEVAVPSPAP